MMLLKIIAVVVYVAGVFGTKRMIQNPDPLKEDLAAVTWPLSLPLLLAFSKKKKDPDAG